ncbi:MAG: hypothetical protein ABIB04_01470 [Patescibacteria group bacterium]
MKIRWSFVVVLLIWTLGGWSLLGSSAWNIQQDLGNILALFSLWFLGTMFVLNQAFEKKELKLGAMYSDVDRWQRLRTADRKSRIFR